MPNLIADRLRLVAGAGLSLNVRRLMYQSLIWFVVPAHDARSLRAPFDAQDLKCTANALIDGVRGDVELGGDFLGRQMLVDEQQAIKLTTRQSRDSLH